MNWDRSFTSYKDSRYSTPKKHLHTSIISSRSDHTSQLDTKEDSDAGWFDIAWDEYKQAKVKPRVMRSIKGAHKFLSGSSIFSSLVTST